MSAWPLSSDGGCLAAFTHSLSPLLPQASGCSLGGPHEGARGPYGASVLGLLGEGLWNLRQHGRACGQCREGRAGQGRWPSKWGDQFAQGFLSFSTASPNIPGNSSVLSTWGQLVTLSPKSFAPATLL